MTVILYSVAGLQEHKPYPNLHLLSNQVGIIACDGAIRTLYLHIKYQSDGNDHYEDSTKYTIKEC